jgi:hypothetical protein
VSRSATVEQSASGQAAFQLVASLLDALDRPLLVSDRSGRPLFTNLHAQDLLKSRGFTALEFNVFSDILNTDRAGVLGQLEGGEQEVNLLIESPAKPGSRPLVARAGLVCGLHRAVTGGGSFRRG